MQTDPPLESTPDTRPAQAPQVSHANTIIPPGLESVTFQGATRVQALNPASEMEIMKKQQDQMAQSLQWLIQLVAAQPRNLPIVPNIVPPPCEEEDVMQRLKQGAGSGTFRINPTQPSAGPQYPMTHDEWRQKLNAIFAKKSWTMGDMTQACYGYLVCQGIHDLSVANMIMGKVREMAASDYMPVFEGMVNAPDPVAYWHGLSFTSVPKYTQVLERKPFPRPRSSSPKGEPNRGAGTPIKKEKK